jgi:nicotinamidase-related amidase
MLQLRKRRISKVILGGMLANMCVESHLRALLEQGFEVAVAKDATAAPKHPEWGYGYAAALINYAFLAHAVLTTDEAVKAMERGQRWWRPYGAEKCRGISQSRSKKPEAPN